MLGYVIRWTPNLPRHCFVDVEKMKRGKIIGIEFDVLRSHDILKLSVVEEDSDSGLIQKPKDLYDARLGIPNERRACQTCGGKRRGVCDAPLACDGHCGHIELPSAIYHPYHVRRVFKLLSKICLGCSKALKKKGRPSLVIVGSDRDSQESGTGKRITRKRKFSETEADKKLPRRRKRNGILKWFNTIRCEDATNQEEHNHHVDDVQEGLWQSSVAKSVSPSPLPRVKEEPIDSSVETLNPERHGQEDIGQCAPGSSNTKNGTKCGVSGGFNGLDKCGPADAEEVRMEQTKEYEDSSRVHPREESSESSTENTCKYCNMNSKESGPKFPRIFLRVVTKVKRSGRIETIKMFIEEKPAGSQIPGGFWDFVGGHPGSESEKSRLLLPFEALNILRKVPVEDHTKLNMDKVVTHPEAFILFTIPVTPNCNRLIMDDWSSTLMPRVILGRGGPNSKLEALVSKVKQIKSSSVGKRTFETEVFDVEELQLLVARHLRACKVVEFSSFNKQRASEKQEPGGSLELKWLKTHVLSKRSNYSARTIVNGDPNVSIDEIGIPYEMALRLTLQERVNTLNLHKWQKVISDIKSGKMVSPPGPLLLRTRNHLFDLREKSSALISYAVKVGDVFTRCLQNGDYVFANRPPSLHKHSLIALRVKLHQQLTFAINPLICAPFDGDFDGDAFHIFVPQAVESLAELRELMSVSAQMICPQGGQALISLTQDTLLGGHLLTRAHSFLNQADMSQLSMFCSAGMPPPAIVKCPGHTGALWTGKQLYSMTLPRELDYGSSDGDILVKHGELLICRGSSGWLQTSPSGIMKAICKSAGSDAALQYLNSAQNLLHQWLLNRGFSVGLKDYYVAKNRESRNTMVQGVKRCLQMSEEASLRQVLQLDKAVQARILSPRPNPHENLEDIKHEGCFGLLLGDGRRYPKIKELQRLAIEKFQSLVPIVDNLVYGYMDSDNSLLAMVKSGSKGSTSRLVQQTACLGLQLYKGESLISVKDPNNKLFYYNQSLKFRREDVFDNKDEIIRQPGYWESKGIITSSYFDGLNPAEFYLHTLSSRGSMLREGIEEPNKIMRNLFLFMRDVYVAYDGTIRNRTGNYVVQFDYGGLVGDSLDSRQEATSIAGEPVGALAATAIAEPSYSVKLDSYHSSSLLKAGPIQLLQETLFPRRNSSLKARDRCVVLRLFPGFGVQRRALRLKRELEKVPLNKFVSSWALEFSSDGGMYEKVNYENTKPSYETVKRSSPWQCRVLLNKIALRDYDLDVSAVKVRLNHQFNSATSKEGLPSIIFVDTSSSSSRVQSGMVDECLVFFPHECGNEAPLSTTPAIDPMEVGKKTTVGDTLKQGRKEKEKLTFERMINVIIPQILNTTVKGHDDIELIKIVWEDGDAASRVPTPSHYPRFTTNKRTEPGELVLELHTRKMKGAGKRGAAFSAVEIAGSQMDDIDWERTAPYSVQEIARVFGVEAALASMKERLRLATRDMGKPVRQQHLNLVADTMTLSGEVVGLSLSGFRDYCKDLSVSTPFTEASFQEPKKNFFEMAVAGARDNLGGSLACAVWGRRIPLGTGAEFDALPVLTSKGQSKDSLAKSSSQTEGSKEGKAYCAKDANNGLKNGLRKSLFPGSQLYAERQTKSDHATRNCRHGPTSPIKKRNGTILNGIPEAKASKSEVMKSASKRPTGAKRDITFATEINGGSCKQTPIRRERVVEGPKESPISKKKHEDAEIDVELHQKLQTLLHERYEVGERVDTESEKLLLEEVLVHHPQRREKVGCGVSFLKVDYHPEYSETRCFHVVRIDGSTCDFSYRKCLAYKGQNSRPA